MHRKRVLLYGEWVEENVLAPVPHWQYVFTLPRLFANSSPGAADGWELCRIAERLLAHAYAEALLEHLELWAPLATERSPPLGPANWSRYADLPLTYHRVSDIA